MLPPEEGTKLHTALKLIRDSEQFKRVEYDLDNNLSRAVHHLSRWLRGDEWV